MGCGGGGGVESIGCGVRCSVHTSWGVQSLLTGSRWCAAQKRPLQAVGDDGNGTQQKATWWRGATVSWKAKQLEEETPTPTPTPTALSLSRERDDGEDGVLHVRQSLEARRSQEGFDTSTATTTNRKSSNAKPASRGGGGGKEKDPPVRVLPSRPEDGDAACRSARHHHLLQEEKDKEEKDKESDVSGEDGLVSFPLDVLDFSSSIAFDKENKKGMEYDDSHHHHHHHHHHLHEAATAYGDSSVEICVRAEDTTFGVQRYYEIGVVTLPVPWLIQACGVFANSERPKATTTTTEQGNTGRRREELFEFCAWFPLRPPPPPPPPPSSSFATTTKERDIAPPPPSRWMMMQRGEVHLRIVLNFHRAASPEASNANINVLKHLSLYKNKKKGSLALPEGTAILKPLLKQQLARQPNYPSSDSDSCTVSGCCMESYIQTHRALEGGGDAGCQSTTPSVGVSVKVNSIRTRTVRQSSSYRNNSNSNSNTYGDDDDDDVSSGVMPPNLVHVIQVGNQRSLGNWNWSKNAPLWKRTMGLVPKTKPKGPIPGIIVDVDQNTTPQDAQLHSPGNNNAGGTTHLDVDDTFEDPSAGPPTTTLRLCLTDVDVEALARLSRWEQNQHGHENETNAVSPSLSSLSLLVDLRRCFDAEHCMVRMTTSPLHSRPTTPQEKEESRCHPQEKEESGCRPLSGKSSDCCCCCCFQDFGHVEIPLAQIILGENVEGPPSPSSNDEDSFTVESWFPIKSSTFSYSDSDSMVHVNRIQKDSQDPWLDIKGDAHLHITVNGLRRARECVRARLHAAVNQPDEIQQQDHPDPSSQGRSSGSVVSEEEVKHGRRSQSQQNQQSILSHHHHHHQLLTDDVTDGGVVHPPPPCPVTTLHALRLRALLLMAPPLPPWGGGGGDCLAPAAAADRLQKNAAIRLLDQTVV
jgi:hypothetical protein